MEGPAAVTNTIVVKKIPSSEELNTLRTHCPDLEITLLMYYDMESYRIAADSPNEEDEQFRCTLKLNRPLTAHELLIAQLVLSRCELGPAAEF